MLSFRSLSSLALSPVPAPMLALVLLGAACRTDSADSGGSPGPQAAPGAAPGFEPASTSAAQARAGSPDSAGPQRTIPASAPGQPRLELVARFEHQVTGVAVSEEGRVFVNFPRWTEDVGLSVAEIVPGGSLKPYPDKRWNAWRSTRKDELSPEEHWVCVQSLFADGRGSLWVLDPAAPALDQVIPGGSKLVRVDLATNCVEQRHGFDERAAPEGSCLNDVRVGTDGKHAFLTDSGVRGALLVVDLESGAARRVLDGHPSTQPEKGVRIAIDGRDLRRADGRRLVGAADGIALSPGGEHLYWQALYGETLYRIPTAALCDESLSADELGSQVERAGTNGVAEGLWIDPRGRMYVGTIAENAVKVRDGERYEILVRSDELRWPDSFAQGPDGALYVTASRVQDMTWFDPEAGLRLSTCLFKVPLGMQTIEGSSRFGP